MGSNGSTSAAAELASFCRSLDWADLPAATRERTKDFLLDHIGVTLRGTAEASSEPATKFVRATQPEGPASVVGAGFRSAAAWAALANGTAAHAIEMDDVTSESSLHPAVAVIPAALAVAEQQQSSTSDLLAAIVVGYEVDLRVGNALNPASAYQRGFHPTGIAGGFGATMAAAYLLDLDADAMTDALGICGSMTSGSMEYLTDGAWTKRLNAGWAAHAGVVAAGLAQSGFNGPRTVFEGPLGIFKGYTDAPKQERLLADLGNPYQIDTVSIKPYGCCRYMHGVIDCVVALREEHAITADDVEKMRVSVSTAGLSLVAEPIEQKRNPQNVVDAQFSTPFGAAVALVNGAADLNQFTPENIGDTTIRELMSRTECFTDPAIDAAYPLQWLAEAQIELRDGRTVTRRIDHATGEPQNPVRREQLIEKFVMLTEPVLGARANAADLAGRLVGLDGEKDLESVMNIVRG